jgi:hypothetical protein
MASVGPAFRSDHFASEPRSFGSPSLKKNIPLRPSASLGGGGGDPMEVSQPQVSPMGPPASSPAGGERAGEQQQQAQSDTSATTNGGSQQQPAVGAAAAAQQPKIVQTAFIHKLYK